MLDSVEEGFFALIDRQKELSINNHKMGSNGCDILR
jgi:hypothetical protein